MEFGYTIPLQKRLGIRCLPCGVEMDMLLCWDLHTISLRGLQALLMVNCKNRYTVVLPGLTAVEWADLPAAAARYLRQALPEAGFSEDQREEYWRQAGNVRVTRTHGRREVAFLNRAWEDVAAADILVDPNGPQQPGLNYAVNSLLLRCAGHAGLGSAWERMALDLAGLSGIPAARQ